MKECRFLGLSSMFLLFFIMACAGNLAEKKRQEEAIRNLGEAYVAKGNYTLALRELLKAEKIYPKDPYLQNDLGLTYRAKRKTDLAIEHFKHALQLKPDYADAKNNLGVSLLDKKDWDGAIELFNEVAEDLLYASPHCPFCNLGSAYYHKNEYKMSEKYYLEALDIKPDYFIALHGLGRTYIAMGRIAEAITVFEKGVKIAPRVPEFHFALARAYALSGDYQQSLRSYNRVIELSPDSPLAREAAMEVERMVK
jgi:type IV pilus assembly protein PilF